MPVPQRLTYIPFVLSVRWTCILHSPQACLASCDWTNGDRIQRQVHFITSKTPLPHQMPPAQWRLSLGCA